MQYAPGLDPTRYAGFVALACQYAPFKGRTVSAALSFQALPFWGVRSSRDE